MHDDKIKKSISLKTKHSPLRSQSELDNASAQRLYPGSDTGSLSHGDVIQLQRLLGNQRTRQLVHPVSPLHVLSGNNPVVQRKKSPLADPFFYEGIRGINNFPENELREKVGENGGVYNYASKVFDMHRIAGERYWKKLETAISSFKGDQKQQFLESQHNTRQDYDKRFKQDYDIEHSTMDGKTFVDSKKGDWSEIPYLNEVRSSENEHSIVAHKNYANKDKTANKLNNSEILWQQFKANREQSGEGSSEDLAKISKIVRDNVVNVHTMLTVYMAYPDGESPQTADKIWQPGSDEFFALLGTDNLKGTPHFLADHLDQINKTIDYIWTSKNMMVVQFKALN